MEEKEMVDNGMGQGACCAGSNDGCPPEAHKVKLKNIFRL